MNSPPNYLIVGAMKCGTTVLQDFICMHPDVRSPLYKDINYFSLQYHLGIEWYLEHFPGDQNKIIGDSSPSYFDVAVNKCIPNLIYSMNSGVKIIIIYRNPVERALSQFIHLKYVNKVEVLSEIEANDFFNKFNLRALTQVSNLDYYLLQCINFSLYSRKLLYYLEVFSPDNIFVLDSEYLKNNSYDCMRAVYNFLGLSPYQDDRFNEIRYSSNVKLNVLDSEVVFMLSNFFKDDYQYFIDISNESGLFK
jgi:hypothetical protein